jgi:hypothetical protein
MPTHTHGSDNHNDGLADSRKSVSLMDLKRRNGYGIRQGLQLLRLLFAYLIR